MVLSVSVPLITPESCSDLLINEKQTPSSAYTSAHNTRQTSPFACMYRRNVLLNFQNWLTCAAFRCLSSAALRLFICYALPGLASVPCFYCQRKFTHTVSDGIMAKLTSNNPGPHSLMTLLTRSFFNVIWPETSWL